MPKMLQLTDEDFNDILSCIDTSLYFLEQGNVNHNALIKIHRFEKLQEYLRKVQKGDYEKQTRTIREDQKDLHN